jgi:hypothetical protein
MTRAKPTRGEQAVGGRWGETAASAAAQQPVQLQQPITQSSESEGSAPGAFWTAASACAAGWARAVRSAAELCSEEIA